MWQATTYTAYLGGSSSMGAGTGLDRSLFTLAASGFVTSFDMRLNLFLGAGSGTYTKFTTGGFAQPAPWSFGLSLVLPGGTVPNLATDADNAQFLKTRYMTAKDARNTVNTAGSPAYQDLYGFYSEFEGRCHATSGTGGTCYFHVANLQSVTEDTEWGVWVRVGFNLIN